MSISPYPLELLGLLTPRTARGAVTLLPSLAVSEEYNDNLFLNNDNRQADFITRFSPGLMLFINKPTVEVNAGYSFTGELYARDSALDNAFATHNFLLGALYRVDPVLTVNVSDAFVWDRSTNAVAPQGFSTGRQNSWSNVFAPGLTWQMAPRTSLSLGVNYSTLHFEGVGNGADSDTYDFLGSLGQQFTARLTGILAYRFTYLDVHAEPTSTVHTPTLGASYQLTPLLTAIVSGGAAITEVGGDTFVTPAGSASLVQRLRIGNVGIQYSRNVSVAGGFGGTTDSQTVSGWITLPDWTQRGLTLFFSPSYSTASSVNSRQGNQVDVDVLTVNFGISYQVTKFVSVFGGYTYLRQRGGKQGFQPDADQNRVKVGLQFGYPIGFE